MTWRIQTEIENGNVPARILTEVEQRVRQDPTWVLFAIIDKARGGRCAQWPRSHMALELIKSQFLLVIHPLLLASRTGLQFRANDPAHSARMYLGREERRKVT
jgi:hypothetical protein